jgi:hypothetical protein
MTLRISPLVVLHGEGPGVGLFAEPMEASSGGYCGDRPTPDPSPQEPGGEFAAPAA